MSIARKRVKWLAKLEFAIITEPKIYVNQCVECSNWTKFECPSLKNGLRNDQTAKITNRVNMRILRSCDAGFRKSLRLIVAVSMAYPKLPGSTM